MRTATCHCGELVLTCERAPAFVAMCHCELCQRRTGTSFSLGAWFDRGSVTVVGSERIYVRTGDDTGAEIRFHFCPTCGTTLYWESPDGGLPDMYGVAVGCFADPRFPGPTLSVHGRRRHEWLSLPSALPAFLGATGSQRDGE